MSSMQYVFPVPKATFWNWVRFKYYFIRMSLWALREEGREYSKKGRDGVGFAGFALQKIISPLTHPWSKFNSFLTLSMWYANAKHSDSARKSLRFQNVFENLVSAIWLPQANKKVGKIKVLCGREDGQVLIDLLEGGAERVIFYKNDNLAKSFMGSLMKLSNGEYITISGRVDARVESAILSAEPDDKNLWWPGTKHGLTIEQIREIYNAQRYEHWKTVYALATTLMNEQTYE